MNRLLPLLFAAAIVLLASPVDHAQASPAAAPVSAAVASTQAALRDLWMQHVVWVRNVVVARIAGNPAAAKAAEDEVVANARAIAASIEPFYGKAGSEKLFGLLAGHWGAISAYLDATHAHRAPDQEAAAKRLTDNAGEIAVFLGGVNPNLPADAVRGLLTAHGAHHMQQIQQIELGQYAQEAQTWGAMTQHIYAIADALAGGIAKQFPEKFN